jgi:copper(I)-binding protein
MRNLVVAVALLAAAGGAAAQLQVKDPWARATVAGQDATGAFMTLTSPDGARLVGAGSPVAGIVEIHEMKMENNVMKMRQIGALDLPAGRAVELKSGGYHVMLMDLKGPLKAGDKVLIELRVELKDKRVVTQPVQVEVALKPPGGAHK